jgi:hypothetical protein
VQPDTLCPWIPANLPSPEIEISAPLYQLKITLIDSRPPVWRRIIVPSEITLHSLDQVLRIVLGWDDCFMHYFEINGVTYASTQPARPSNSSLNGPLCNWWYFLLDILAIPLFAFLRCILPAAIDERKVQLCSVVKEVGATFHYQYATFTAWRYLLSLEKLVSQLTVTNTPICAVGKGASPKQEFIVVCAHDGSLEVLRDQTHPRHRQLIEAFGEDYAVEQFNIEHINSQLRQVNETCPSTTLASQR